MADERIQGEETAALPEITPGSGVGSKAKMKPNAFRSNPNSPPASIAVPEVLPPSPGPGRPVDGADMPKIESVPGGGSGVKMKMKRAAQIGVAPVQMVAQLPSFAYRHRKVLLICGSIALAVFLITGYFTKRAHEAQKRNEVLTGSQLSMDKVNRKFADAESLQEVRLVTNTVKHEKGVQGGRSTLLVGLSNGDRAKLAPVIEAEGELLGTYTSLAGATQTNLANKSTANEYIAEVGRSVKKLQNAISTAERSGIHVTMNVKLLSDAEAIILKLLRKARGKKPAKSVKKVKKIEVSPVPSRSTAPSGSPAPSRPQAPSGSQRSGGGNGGGGNGGGGNGGGPGGGGKSPATEPNPAM